MTSWNIEVRSARHVVALAKHLSYTHAAAELGITQSALTRSIQRLEAAVDVRLFDRNRGGVHLTVVGSEVAKRAFALVQEADRLERMLQKSAVGMQDSITFGMGHLPAKALLSQVMTQILAENPELHIKAVVRSPETLLSLLLLDEIEFLICADRLVPDEAPVRRSQIGLFKFGQLVRPQHPLLDRFPSQRPDEFPWVLTKFFGEQPRAENYALSHLRPRPQLEIEDLECLSQITQNSDVIWVTSPAAARPELQLGHLCQLPFPPAHNEQAIKMMMYSRSDRTLSPAALSLAGRFRLATRTETALP